MNLKITESSKKFPLYCTEKRRTCNSSPGGKALIDGFFLYNKARDVYNRKTVTVEEVFALNQRTDEDRKLLRKTIADIIKNPGSAEINQGLQSLIIDPINAFSKAPRVLGRSGEEIAQAIPDVRAFLEEMKLMNKGRFFELNDTGQLVMMDDGRQAAYNLGDDFPTARQRATRVIYRDENGYTQIIQGDGTSSTKIHSILMTRGLPTLSWNQEKKRYVGEYARMDRWLHGELAGNTWVEDDTLDPSHARSATRDIMYGGVVSHVHDSGFQNKYLGSRYMLRINLDFKT